MTKQEVFDKVVTHLRKQRRKSQAIDGKWNLPQCRYRGPDKTMCAAGCLIPDSEYDPRIEGNSIYGLHTSTMMPPSLKAIVDAHGEDFLTRLQAIHDGWEVEYWEGRFEVFAEDYGLTVPLSTEV